VITTGRASTGALDGSTEAEQFREATPDFARTEVHHIGSAEVEPLAPPQPLLE
jgi:hypothetical protein